MAVDKKYLDLDGLGKVINKIKSDLLPVDKTTVEASFVKVGRTERGYVSLGTAVDKQDVAETGILSAENTADKVFLAGPTVQGGTPSTLNSNASVYMQDGKLYSEGKLVALKEDVAKAVVFRGTLGTDGTITELPTPSAETEGDMYIVTTDGTYAEKEAKKGDTFICGAIKVAEETVYQWLLIPSGDEPSGTVTQINIGNGLAGSTNPITSTGTISHATYTQEAAGIKKIGRDEYGHVLFGTEVTVKSAGHTHTFAGTATVPNVTATPGKLSINAATASVVTDIEGVSTQKLQRAELSVATVSRATAATPITYGTADVGATVTIIPAKDNGTAVKVASTEDVNVGNANVGTPVVYGKANVGEAVTYGTANVGATVTIVPAVDGGQASKAAFSKTIYYGNAIPGTAKTAVESVGFENNKQAFEASYTEADCALNLTAITLSAATYTFNPADVASESSGLSFNYYTFSDVDVAKVGTGVKFTPAAASTLTLTPATAAPASQTLKPAESSSKYVNNYTFEDVNVAMVDTAKTFTPAKSAETTFTPYTFEDISVAATTVAVNYATGKLVASGDGDDVAVGLGTISRATNILTNSTKLKSGDTGDVDVVKSITAGTETVTVNGAIGGGDHTHGLE